MRKFANAISKALTGFFAFILVTSMMISTVDAANIKSSKQPTGDKAINVTTLGIKNDGSDVTDKLNSLPQGNYVFPAGTYGVNGFANGSWKGFMPKSNSTYTFEKGAVIKVLTNSYPAYAGIFIRNATNVVLVNPTVQGDRTTHNYTAGSTHEWGHGILVANGNGKVTIESPYVYDVTGDGIDLISSGSDVTINNVRIERARRQGISIEDAGIVTINGGTISDISGASPSSGIDIEPYEQGQHLDKIVINNIVTKNTKQGLLLANLHLAVNYNVTINNSTFDGIFVNNIEKTAVGKVDIYNPIINGSNVGLAWTNAYANVNMYNPVFNLSSIKTGALAEGIFLFYDVNKEAGEYIGGFKCTNAQILNSQTENAGTTIFNFSTSANTTIADISITVASSNLTNTIWATTPTAIKSIYLSAPNNTNVVASL